MARPRIAILASGSGTTAEAFIEQSAAGNIEATAELVICNNARAGIIKRVAELNEKHGLSIDTAIINNVRYPDDKEPEDGEQTLSAQQAMIDILQRGNYDLIALMGFMKKIGPLVVAEFGWHEEYTSPYQAMMLNTHPGLLPETKGLYGIHVQEHVLDNHLAYGGQTLHVVAQDYDDGPIVSEHKVAVKPGDTPESFFDRVQKTEKENLPGDIDAFIKARLEYFAQKETA